MLIPESTWVKFKHRLRASRFLPSSATRDEVGGALPARAVDGMESGQEHGLRTLLVHRAVAKMAEEGATGAAAGCRPVAEEQIETPSAGRLSRPLAWGQ